MVGRLWTTSVDAGSMVPPLSCRALPPSTRSPPYGWKPRCKGRFRCWRTLSPRGESVTDIRFGRGGTRSGPLERLLLPSPNGSTISVELADHHLGDGALPHSSRYSRVRSG